MKPLGAVEERILRRLREAERVFSVLDCDGTLALGTNEWTEDGRVRAT